jgi:molybdopterin/thiamine biosynthesis adenylyltransferase
MARAINPELVLDVFDSGVSEQNVDAFLEGADLYVDGLDFFAFSARKAVFATCARNRIPAVTAAPLGMGSAVLTFMPGGMTFEQYFCWDGCTEDEMALRFVVGLSPTMLQRRYLADPTAVDFRNRKVPSTAIGCEICAGMAATEILKILLDRGSVLCAPHGIHFDAYRNKLVRTWRPGGNRNPLQRLVLAVATRQFSRASERV